MDFDHIIALAADVPLIKAALKDFEIAKGARRPQLAAPRDESDDEPVELEVVDGGFSTDSDVGMPASSWAR